MNDRYLFRGNRVDNGEWVVGCLRHGKYIKPCIIDECIAFEIDPDTVGQCTGLKDKNGNLIYEGDILLQKTTPKFKEVNPSQWEKIYVVRFGYCDFREGISGYSTHGFYLSDIDDEFVLRKGVGAIERDNELGYYPYEIIGNIHDNPELLK